MPNKRADGNVVRSYAVPADLHDRAAERAASEGRALSEVIRELLAGYADSPASSVRPVE